MQQRYVELDLLRSLAIIMMIVYHLAYDLESYYGFHLGIFERTGWILLRQCTATLFLLLVGVSFAISWKRHRVRHGEAPFAFRYKKYFLRGLGVIACGMLVTLVTFLWEPATYVRFGILHMIGASILLLPFFVALKEGNAVIGMMIVGLGMIIPMTMGSTAFTPLPLGFMPPDFASVDYFPLIPWFGIVLIGAAVGHFLYVRHQVHVLSSSLFRLPSSFASPGRHALAIYLLHQPIILGILGLLARFRFL